MTDRLYKMGVTVGNAPASQVPSALYWYGEIIRSFGVKSILELGTEKGGLAVFFGLHCPGAVTTVDLVDQLSEQTRDLCVRLGVMRVVCDCLTPESAKGLIALVPNGPRLVFCDAGDKPKEFALYSTLLEPGDLIGVHDCGTEFFPDHPDTAEIANRHGLYDRVMAAELDADRTVAAFWRKVK